TPPRRGDTPMPDGSRGSVVLLAALVLVFPSTGRGKETGPWDLESLRRPPKVTAVEAGRALASLYYEGQADRGQPTRGFCYLARPEKAGGKLPAMMLVHGGGGTAFREWAELWAKRGYVALAMDLGGQGPDRKRLPDGGPPQDDPGKFQADAVKDFW